MAFKPGCSECGSFAINHHCHGRDGSDGHLCDVCYWRKRAEANARLIAAAPELLGALEAFSRYIHSEQCSTDGPVHYSDGQLTALAVRARIAIAKAKGTEA